MRLSSEDKQVRRDYRRRLWESTPAPQLFPLGRVIVTLLLSASQFAFSILRHKWNPKAPPPQLAKEMWISFAIVIVLYMVIYGLEWSWNYVAVAPRIMDRNNQEQLTTQKNEISSLRQQVDSSEKVRKVKRELAPLLNQQAILQDRLLSAANGAELSSGANAVQEWRDQVVTLLREADEPTDAEVFSQAGRVVSALEIAKHPDVWEWKREEVARLDLYCKQLAQIREKRRF
jgi:hypothetical protein